MCQWDLVKKDTLKLKARGLNIFVHKIEPSYGWFVSCVQLGICNHYIDTEDLEKAKNEGIKVVVEKIEKLEEVKYFLSPSKINYGLLWHQLKDLLNNKNLPSSTKTLEIMENMELRESEA